MPDGFSFADAQDMTQVYEAAGKQYGVDPDLLRAQTQVESGDNDAAVSSAGAVGRSQFLPSTARAEGLENPRDPVQAIPAQAKLLRENMDRYGDPYQAIAAYNGGTDQANWGPKTDAYVRSVADLYAQRKAAAQPQGFSFEDAQKPAAAAPATQGFSFDEATQPAQGMPAKSGLPFMTLQSPQQSARMVKSPGGAGSYDANEPMAATDKGDYVADPKWAAQDQADTAALVPSREGPAPAAAAPQPVDPTAGVPIPETPNADRLNTAIREGWEGSPTVLSPETQAKMDTSPLVMNRFVYGPAAHIANAALAAGNAGFRGMQEAAVLAGETIGQPQLGRDIAGYMETPEALAGGPHTPQTLLQDIASGRGEMPGAATAAERPGTAAQPAAASRTPTLDAMAAQAVPRPEQTALDELKPTEPEPPRDVAAQVAAVADPRNPKDAAFVSPGNESAIPPALPPGVEEVPRAEGTLLTRNPNKAAEFQAAPTVNDETMAGLLGYPETKEEAAASGNPAVVQGMNAAGDVVTESVASSEGIPAAQEAAAERAPNVQVVSPQDALARRAETPFSAVPPEPERLSTFLRRQGGVQDVGGDIRSSLGGSKYRPGLINQNGLPLDDAALRAWQAGYFPEFGAERPAINDLREALHDDLNGRPVYSHQDEGSVAAYQDALSRNSEIDRLSDEHGIPTTGLTHEQFFGQLADRLSPAAITHEIETANATHEDAYREFEAALRDEAPPEQHTRADLHGQSQARTLEDLEREYQQETATTATQQRDAGDHQPGSFGWSEGAGEEGSGPRGGSAGPAGRGEVEAPATDLLGRPIQEAGAPRVAEPTIRNDARQDVMPGMEASAVQAQAARDATGRGALQTDAAQKPANEGLFAPDTSGQGALYSFPGMLFDPEAWRTLLGIKPGTKPEPGLEVLRDKKGLARASAEVRAGLAPTSLRGAKPMEHALRAHNAETAQAFDQSFHALEKVRAAVDRLPREAQVDFTDRMEKGEPQATPELTAVATALRQQIDGWAKKIQGLGKGYLANAIENYMGHIWGNYADWAARRPTELTQTEMEAKAKSAGMQRQPLRGSGSFLKQRSFPTQREGIEAGLEPVTYNPVDLQLIKLHEMQKFYHGTVLADQLKQAHLARWVPATAEAERDAQLSGMVKLDDAIFKPRIMGANNEAGYGRLEPGNYWADESPARVFNNYMSQGWHGQSSIYDAVRMGNNAMNTMQLGMSGFHATFVTADTAISKVALGLQQIAGGHPIRGAGNLVSGASIAPAMVRTVMRGAELRKAWLEPENATPEMQKIVDALKTGGGRVSMPRFYQTSASGAFFHSLADMKNPSSAFYSAAQMFRDAKGPLDKAVMTPLRIAGRLIDTLNQPLMGTLVPRAKLGVFADMAQNWLRDNPTATREQVAAQMTKFQDSVDNRLGQLNYDNLFWNKVAKDIAFVTTRSVGWNLGTVREIGGAFVDSGSAVKAIANGKAPQFTTRMAYTMALPVVTAEIGAILTYLATGKPPQSMLDYFYPPTGNQDDAGQPERRSIPGYMKDVVAFWMSPLQTALNKTAPMLETIQELAHNKDYYGGSIYDPVRDKGPAQAYGDYLINQTTPFSLRAWNKLHGEGAPALDQSLGFWGFQPAPKSITAPERGEAFEARDATKAYRARMREPGRVQLLNAPPP